VAQLGTPTCANRSVTCSRSHSYEYIAVPPNRKAQIANRTPFSDLAQPKSSFWRNPDDSSSKLPTCMAGSAPRPARMGNPVRRIAVVLTGMEQYQRLSVAGLQRYVRERDDWRVRLDQVTKLKPGDVARANFDGFIGEVYPDTFKDELLATGKPIVALYSEPQFVPGHIAIGIDNRAVGRAAADFFRKKGFTNFAVVGTTYEFSLQRLDAFVETATAKNLPVHVLKIDTDEVMDHPMDFSGGIGSHVRWLATLPRGTALFATSDRLAFAVISACEMLRIDVPQHLAVLGVDNDTDLCDLIRPAMSSVAIPWEYMGYRAGQLLDGLFKGKRPGSGMELVQPTGVIERASSDTLAVTDAEVARAMRFIRDHLHRPIGVDDVVESAKVPRRTLQRRFSAATGRSILADLQQVRIDRAKQLLESTDHSLEMIANAVGFSRANWFASVFQRLVGESPSEYRRGVVGH
jgi:LacI family transcriptional regulator